MQVLLHGSVHSSVITTSCISAFALATAVLTHDREVWTVYIIDIARKVRVVEFMVAVNRCWTEDDIVEQLTN